MRGSAEGREAREKRAVAGLYLDAGIEELSLK